MVCVHLKELYDLCLTHQLKLGGSDLIRVICTQCDRHDVCPSTIHEEGDASPESGELPAPVSRTSSAPSTTNPARQPVP